MNPSIKRLTLALALGVLAPALWLSAAVRSSRVNTYCVMLSAPSVGERLPKPPRARSLGPRRNNLEVRRLAAEVEQTQQPVRSAIQSMGLPVTGSLHHVLNAVFVRATAGQAAQLRALAGVRAVAPVRRYRLQLDAAANLINAPAAWNALGGVSSAGAGIKIGILDSGIDNTNPAFQDSSLTPPSGYPIADSGDLGYTNNKIIVARNYLSPGATIDPTTSRPDDYTPRDRSGHGTFIAMMAAGRTVSSPHGGPAITGIAPKAFLGNYKIAGSTDINDGPTDQAILTAMDDAVNDGMDILNLSVGSIALFGPNDQGFACSSNATTVCDPVAQAVQTATEQFGVVVVAASGNYGDAGSVVPTLNTIASPGTAPDAVAVGASTNSRQLTSALKAGPGAPASLQAAPALFGNGPRPGGPLTTRIRNVTDLGDDGTACNPLPAGSLTGIMALVARGNCEFDLKIRDVQAAGAIAMVVYNSAGEDDPITMEGLANAVIPSMMIGNSAGVALSSFIRSTASATVTLDPQLISHPTTPDLMATFSSRGPSIDLGTKPDLVAPGVNIFSATQTLDANGAEYDSTGFTTLDGTSFSTALVAGAAALVEQQFSTISALQVKSALVNTATPAVLENGSQARETAMGAGKLNAQAAVNPGAAVEPSSFTFGQLGRTTAFPLTGQITLTNIGSASDTFTIQVQQRDPDSNAQVTVNGGSSASVQLGAGQNASISVSLSGKLPNPGFYEGVLLIKGSSGPANLHAVYHYGVASGQPASIFAVTGDGDIGTTGQELLDLLILKLVDKSGLSVPNVNVQFQATQGNGKIVQADAQTDQYGIAAADVDLGDPGPQVFTATAGGLTVTFNLTARPLPVISGGGVVNGASFANGQAVAPGSIISVFGSDLSGGTAGAGRLPLPLALDHVSMSFDNPTAGVSVPGHFFFVSPGQINVQVPW
ncbi:MAG TPA: S8 family serine peptidase, partial [Bryobacterales bacterium]|nr:S8 family serine peptidase [Bryobacterales bacterium]